MRFAGWDRVAAFGCGLQLNPQAWDYVAPSPAPYGTLCNYEPAIGSWAICVTQVIDEHVSGADHAKFLAGSVDWANFVCERAGGGAPTISPETFWNAKQNATEYLQPFPDVPGKKLNFPIELDSYDRKRKISAVHAEFANLDNSNDASLWIYWYFGALFATLILCNIPSVKAKLLQSKLVNTARSRYLLPTLWLTDSHSSHSKWACGGLWPSSMESTILSGLFLVHTAALFANYSIDKEEVLETTLEQSLQALGNRSGILAFALLPLLIAFSMRYPFLQQLGGFKYTTFIVFHRWLGRLMMIDSVIHSFAFYYHAKLVNEISIVWLSWFWLTGIVATIIACLMVIFATGAFRRRWYETFLYSHIGLAILFFYLCWQHVILFGWTNWIWASVALWIAERSYRIYTIIYHGGGVQTATLTPLGENLLAITIPKPKRWVSFPSHYAFVYFLHHKIFWQSHPLTVCDIGSELRIVVSIKGGATKHIDGLASSTSSFGSHGVSATVPVLLEGPYGHDSKVDKFDRVLLFAGGSGIPGPLAIAETAQNAHLIIIARNAEILYAYQDQINSLNVPVDIHITRHDPSDSSASHLPNVHMGRPNIKEIIHDFVIDLTLAKCSGAVVCCGPPALNDQVRNTVAKSLEQFPETSLEYIEEFQVW